MRLVHSLAGLVLLANSLVPFAAAEDVLIDTTETFGEMPCPHVDTEVGGIFCGVPIDLGAPAFIPESSFYRLRVEWWPAAPEYEELRANLSAHAESESFLGLVRVQGPVVHATEAVARSPIELEVPAGDGEKLVRISIGPAASLTLVDEPQSVHVRLTLEP